MPGADRGHPHRTGLRRLHNGQRGWAHRRIERNILIVDRIVPLHPEFFGQRRAERDFGPVHGAVERLIAAGERFLAEQIDAEREPRAECVRVGEGKVEPPDVLAVGHRHPGDVAGAEKIRIAHGHRGERAAGRRIAAGDIEVSGLVLLDDDIEDDAVGRRARLRHDLDRLEIAQRLQPAFGALDQRAVVAVAFAEIEFAPDHRVARLGVAVNVDALDIDAFAGLDGVDEIDDSRPVSPGIRGGRGGGHALAADQHGGKRFAVFGEPDGRILDGLVHGVGIVGLARLRAQVAVERGRIDGL